MVLKKGGADDGRLYDMKVLKISPIIEDNTTRYTMI
jgi:hypothetical protein